MMYSVVLVSLSGFLKKLELKAKHLPRAGQIPQEPPNFFFDLFEHFLWWPCVFVFTKDFLKNTKENITSDHFYSHF